MEDLLWSMTQESRALQELRLDIGGFWQDEAARELISRFLDPHETEDQHMLAGLNRQKDALDQSNTRLASAESHGQHAEECSVLIVEGLKSTEQDLQSAYRTYDHYVHYNSEARSKLPAIQNLIRQANDAGNT